MILREDQIRKDNRELKITDEEAINLLAEFRKSRWL